MTSLSSFSGWTLIFVASFRIIIAIALYSAHIIHRNMYTYWNYVLQTLFYVILAYAFWNRQHRHRFLLFNVLTTYVFPLVFGSVFLVFLFIIILVDLNGDLFVDTNDIINGTVDIGRLHTGDTVIHVFTLIDFFIVLTSGYLEAVRGVIIDYIHRLTYAEYVRFLIWWYVSPFIPMVAYTIFYNPFEEYPTSLSSAVLIALGIIIGVVVMSWLYLAVSQEDKQQSPSSYHPTHTHKKMRQLTPITQNIQNIQNSRDTKIRRGPFD